MELKLILLLALVTVAGYMLLKMRRRSRLAYIDNYRFHPMLAKKVKERYPALSDSDVSRVFDALRDYFHLCNLADRKMVAMPSQVVDVAWHEFILSTRSYKQFCEKGIGRFLHHTPTEVMKTPTVAQEGIKRAWRLACAKEQINPAFPARLPLLFAIDAELEIPDGYRYTRHCKNSAASQGSGTGYCAGDIGCVSGCAGDSGADTPSGAGSGDSSCSGSSCGGSSCGGGA